jgi:hypothetical protein
VPIYNGDLGGVTPQDGSHCAGDLSDLKARIALMFAFGAGWSPTRWGWYFERIGADDEVTIA